MEPSFRMKSAAALKEDRKKMRKSLTSAGKAQKRPIVDAAKMAARTMAAIASAVPRGTITLYKKAEAAYEKAQELREYIEERVNEIAKLRKLEYNLDQLSNRVPVKYARGPMPIHPRSLPSGPSLPPTRSTYTTGSEYTFRPPGGVPSVPAPRAHPGGHSGFPFKHRALDLPGYPPKPYRSGTAPTPNPFKPGKFIR